MFEYPRIASLGDAALSIEFGDIIDQDINGKVMALYAALGAQLSQGQLVGVVELVPTFRALAVHYDPMTICRADLELAVSPFLGELDAVEQVGRIWALPACYEGDMAPDIVDVADRAGVTVEQVIALHTSAEFRVYILGFVPGFAFLSGVPKALCFPRRTDPRTAVPAGSVAIAGDMSAVYPLESPGGWHLIGRCPVPMFNPIHESPVFLAPGDTVRFKAIDLDAYTKLSAEIARGDFDVQALQVEG